MIWDILSVAVGTIAVGAGLIGCIVPILPGPPVAFVSLLLVSLAGGWTVYSVHLLVLLAVLAIAASVLDSILPAAGSKRAGAGKAGVWGSVAGMIIGTFFFPPFGTFIGAFAGALVGEFLASREGGRSFRAAMGVFTGTMAAMVAKLAVTGTVAVVFVRGALRLFG